MSEETNAVVTRRIEIAPGLIVVQIAPDGWNVPDFEPGQFAVLGLPGSARRCDRCEPETDPPDPKRVIKRAYSIASSSVAREFLEFYVALVPSGRLTPRLWALEVGDRVWLGPRIKGLFTLDEVPDDRHVVFVSTGTGLAPYMSMIRTAMTCGGERRFAILHGARNTWDLGYQAELSSLTRLCPNFVYVPSVSRPDAEPVPWSGETGYVQDVWDRRLVEARWGLAPTPDNSHVFVCGNPSMIEHMTKVLVDEGFKEHKRRDPGNLHIEKYW